MARWKRNDSIGVSVLVRDVLSFLLQSPYNDQHDRAEIDNCETQNAPPAEEIFKRCNDAGVQRQDALFVSRDWLVYDIVFAWHLVDELLEDVLRLATRETQGLWQGGDGVAVRVLSGAGAHGGRRRDE